jgi:TPR repeat protein
MLLRTRPLQTLLIAFALAFALPVPATLAKSRHALVLGVGDYKDGSGLAKLKAPSTDAAQVKKALEAPGIEFDVVLLQENDVKDKANFQAALQKFLAKVEAGDEVLFYFSGHGFNMPDKGNFFLLADAKSQQVFLKELSAGEARELDTSDKKDKRYQEWLSKVALSETDIVDAIVGRRPEVMIIVTDACRSPVSGGKGFAPAGTGVVLPKEIVRGTFRLYSARAGQMSLDSTASVASSKSTDSRAASKDPKKDMSLFTAAFVRELNGPPLEINVLAAKIKIDVRKRASLAGVEQIPDYTDDPQATNFFFRQGAAEFSSSAFCQTARAELAQLRYGVAAGSIGRDELEDKRIGLAPCGLDAEIESLMRLESQGAGALSEVDDATAQVGQPANQAADSGSKCDARASSPFDPNRLQHVAGVDIQKVALKTLSGELDRKRGLQTIAAAVEACTAAVKERPRVARYKFNLGRAQYATATLSETAVERTAALALASQSYQDAVDVGYAAAYNNLALLHQNGEYHRIENGVATPRPRDRDKARELFQRGAELGDIIALYNLGMAYKNGDLGLTVGASEGRTLKTRDALAFQYLSKSAEGGYVPAMIQTALALHNEMGVERNPKRAVELLELAASRGSWEAMYFLGEIYRIGFMSDLSEAVVWHARAAEAGDTRSQAKLAKMLTAGEGLPAPQREAAGRYWRLAADGGSVEAQMQLAVLLRDGKVPARPRVDGNPDGGGQEIRDLFRSALAKDYPEAGLELARLYRKGYPEDHPSAAIPKDPAQAISLLWDTIDIVRNAEPSSWEANPEVEIRASVELINMFDAGESKRNGQNLITDDQIAQLRDDYGDTSRLTYVRAAAAGGWVKCKSAPDLWVLIWNSNRSEPPVEQQFDWYERNHKCKQKDPDDTRTKEEDLGVSKKTREVFRREYEAALKDKEKRKSFVDRMVELVNKNVARRR